MNAIVECEAIVKSLSPSRSCSTRHSQNICLPTDKYMTTRNVSLENTGFENTKKYSENKTIIVPVLYFSYINSLNISNRQVYDNTECKSREHKL